MKRTLILIVLMLAITACSTSTEVDVDLVAGDDVVEIGNDHVDQGCYLVTEDARLPMDVVKDTVDTSNIGEYEIIYRLNEQGEEHTCKRVVKVIEEGPLRATLKPGIDTITVGEEHVDAGIDVTRKDTTVDVTDTVDPTTPGTYTITYHVTDDDENETTITRRVTVLEAD
ncbi:MAG: immunoglobulin-like domain-containing protein [Acholeplasmataceae bacterium]